MSRRQPEIRIVYPSASAAALLLTEAMIKRSSGKRTVETESEEKEYNGEALFGGVLACKTSTGVELTLRLNPDAMDYALTTLIARNLTEDEKQAVRAATDSMEIDSLLSPAQAAEAAGQALDGSSSPDVPSAEREAAGASTCTEEVGTLREPTEEGEDITKEEAKRREREREAARELGVDDFKNIEKLILNCLNDHLPDADDLTKTGVASDVCRRLKLNIELRLKKHKVGLLANTSLRMILRDLIDNLGGSAYSPAVVTTQIDNAVEEIDREANSIEVEEFEDTTAFTAAIGMAIQCMTLLKDSKKDKTVHALHVLGKHLEKYIDLDLILDGYQIERAFEEAAVLIDEVPLASADILGLTEEVKKFIAGEKESGLHVTIDEDEEDKKEIEPGLLNDIEDKENGEENE